MKILFLCGTLEPGRDGVGDYVRRLAIELKKIGHETAAIAINDKYSRSEFIGTQILDSLELSVVRVPAKWKKKDNVKFVKDWIDTYNPTWISLQFVPFSFNPKGLPFGIGSYMQAISKGRSWHVMFHELWLGMSTSSSLNRRLWGWCQKQIITTLIRKVKPKIIHTQCELYKLHLEKLGEEAEILPLFSNIPNLEQTINANNNSNDKRRELSLVIFGSIHPGAPFNHFTNEAEEISRKENLTISLSIIGRSGIEQERLAQIWKSKGLPVKLLGEQPVERISGELRKASIGISTTALPVIEKSGSVAAMLEHGLQVLVVAYSWKPRTFTLTKLPDHITEYREGILKQLVNNYLSNTNNAPPFKTVYQISQQLLKSFEKDN